MSYHKIGDNWYSGDELARMENDNFRMGAAGLFGIAGAFFGPWLSSKIGITSVALPAVAGLIGGGILGYLFGGGILAIGVIGLLIWFFI